MVFKRLFVKRFTLCYRTVVLSCLSVTFMHCGQTKLGIQVGLGPGHIVLDGDQAPHPPIFGPYLLWPNGCMDQDATWYGGRPQPRVLGVRWGPSPLSNFQPISIVASSQKGRNTVVVWCGSIVAKRLDASRGHLVWR